MKRSGQIIQFPKSDSKVIDEALLDSPAPLQMPCNIAALARQHEIKILNSKEAANLPLPTYVRDPFKALANKLQHDAELLVDQPSCEDLECVARRLAYWTGMLRAIVQI